MPSPSRTFRLRWPACTVATWCLAGLYLSVAIAGMVWLAPGVPYADPWRFYARLLDTPWPANVLAVDNGHAEILPNLVRWLDLTQFHGSQWLQILTGLVWFVLCLWLWVTHAPDHREATNGAAAADTLSRAAWALTGVIGLAWFGSGRTLTHANESVHAYLLLACLFGAIRLADAGDGRRLAAALLLGLIATLTFGTGIAVFAALWLVLWLRRAGMRALASCAVAALVSVIIYYLLPRAHGGASGGMALEPWAQAGAWLRWLGAPYLYAAGPLVDTTLLERLPPALHAVFGPMARLSEQAFGPARTAVWPERGLGLVGLLLLGGYTWNAWRRADRCTPREHLALATGWFAAACGLLVVLARVDYFRDHPTQIYSNRYLVWSALFWAALLAQSALRLHAGGHRRTAGALPLLVALILLPSTLWMWLPARHMQQLARYDAIGVAVGAIDRQAPHGENVVAEMVRARPILKAHHTSIFAWPASRLLGHRVDTDARPLPLSQLTVTALDNAFGTPAARVTFRAGATTTASRAVLVDHDGTAVGIATRQGSDGIWSGVATGTPARWRGLHAVVPGT